MVLHRVKAIARRLARTGCAWTALAVGAGCASFPPPPVASTALRVPAGLQIDRPPDGSLRPGDEIVIDVTSGAASQRRTAWVDATGQVHAAAGRDLQLSGLSLEQAQARVMEAVRQSDKFAAVTLQRSPRIHARIAVLGALAKQGELPLTPGMRLVDAVALSGGLLASLPSGRNAVPAPVADLEGAVLLREGKRLPVSLEQALRGAPSHNVYLHPGDQLYVPFATGRSVSVLGQVHASASLPHRTGLRLTQALSEAGGVTDGGDKDDIRLVRGPVDGPSVYRASLSDIAGGRARDVALASGDVVFVTDHAVEDAGEVVRLVAPVVVVGLTVLTVLLLVAH